MLLVPLVANITSRRRSPRRSPLTISEVRASPSSLGLKILEVPTIGPVPVHVAAARSCRRPLGHTAGLRSIAEHDRFHRASGTTFGEQAGQLQVALPVFGCPATDRRVPAVVGLAYGRSLSPAWCLP